MTIDRRIARMARGSLPRRLPVAPMGLVADAEAHILYDRRRGDCANLARCELAWIAEHGSEQATCPRRCAAYQVLHGGLKEEAGQ